MLRCVLGLLVVLGTGSFSRADDARLLKKLAGEYAVTELHKDGQAQPREKWKGATATITGDELCFTFKEKQFPAKLTKLDEAVSPGKIDIAPSSGPEKGKTFLGIYSYQNGVLTLAFTEKGSRPTSFQKATRATVITLKRIEAKKN